MGKASLAAIAIVAAAAGAGMHFMNATHERQIAELRKQLDAAKQQTVEMAKLRESAEDARFSLQNQLKAETAARRAIEERDAKAKITADAMRKVADIAKRDVEAKRAADAAKAAQEKAAAEERARRERAAGTQSEAQALYDQAQAAESEGRGAEAVRLYIRAARSGGGGKAALRLGEIYDKGITGVSRDYAESLKWYNAARVLGEPLTLPAR